jgi:hypothetical protein
MAVFIVSSSHWPMAGGTNAQAKLACAGWKMGAAGESLNGFRLQRSPFFRRNEDINGAHSAPVYGLSPRPPHSLGSTLSLLRQTTHAD